MKKLFLCCSIITICNLVATQAKEPSTEPTAPSELVSVVHVIQTLSEFFIAAAKDALPLTEELIELKGILDQNNEPEIEKLYDAVKQALAIVHTLRQDEQQFAALYQQLQQELASLEHAQHKTIA